jgi:hypothetical protein
MIASGGTINDSDSGELLASTHMFWFARQDHFPDTEVWLPEGYGDATTSPNGGDETDRSTSDNRTFTRIAITAGLGIVALAFILWTARKGL